MDELNTNMAKALQKLFNEYDAMLDRNESWGLAYRIVRPFIPLIIANIDEEAELRVKISAFINQFAEAVKENEIEVAQPVEEPELSDADQV